MKFIFWNLNRRTPPGLLSALVLEQRPDFLLLAECADAEVALLERVNGVESAAPYLSHSDPLGRVRVLSCLPRETVRRVHDDRYVSIRRVAAPGAADFLLVIAHLPSKLRRGETDQALAATRLARLIEESEARAGHARTIVVGDLNMNPFEPGLVGAEGLHAVMSRDVARRGARTVDGCARRFFYNPMWGRMGDLSPGPPGTYYYGDSRQVCFFWNTFDQVLVRPALVDEFVDEGLGVLTSIGETRLLDHRGVPRTGGASDHLPITFRMERLSPWRPS